MIDDDRYIHPSCIGVFQNVIQCFLYQAVTVFGDNGRKFTTGDVGIQVAFDSRTVLEFPKVALDRII